MLAAITLAGAGAAALVAVVLYVVVRVVWWIWRWLDQSIVVSSWGLLLEGFNDEELKLQLAEMITDELEATGIGRTSAHRHIAVYWSGLQAKVGIHPIGQDLYLSWNLMSRTNPLLNPKQRFGLIETNEMLAFANATLAATQRAIRKFLMPRGKELPGDRLAPSGILGELPGTVPQQSAAVPFVGQEKGRNSVESRP